jgi:hypothetical protein
MNIRLSRSPLILAAAVAVGAALAFASSAGAAVSLQSESPPTAEVTLGTTAVLDARGAVVFAPVEVVCRPGSYASLTVAVTERVGRDIASGVTYTDFAECTGSVQALEIAVSPTQRAFRKGVAFGQARLQVCDYECHTAVDQHNIQIVARR